MSQRDLMNVIVMTIVPSLNKTTHRLTWTLGELVRSLAVIMAVSTQIPLSIFVRVKGKLYEISALCTKYNCSCLVIATWIMRLSMRSTSSTGRRW